MTMLQQRRSRDQRTTAVCLMCDGRLAPVRTYDRPLKGETLFGLGAGDMYRRHLSMCVHCGHYMVAYENDLEAFYQGEYMQATYGDDLRLHFDRVVSLPDEQSDNAGRVARIIDFVRQCGLGGRARRRVLDVGSGLAVFGHRMRQAGWQVVALDPDERACEHARTVAGVEAVCADFMAVSDLGMFDVVTFNKVVEHVRDPVAMVRKAREYLRPGGVVYVEVPDGELAARAGLERKEFWFGHWHVFSTASLALLLQRAAFNPLLVGRVRDPSGKFTLWSFGKV